jgi:hypothetical protein
MIYAYNEILLKIKRNKLMTHGTTWIILKIIMTSERNQRKRKKYVLLEGVNSSMNFCKCHNVPLPSTIIY